MIKNILLVANGVWLLVMVGFALYAASQSDLLHAIFYLSLSSISLISFYSLMLLDLLTARMNVNIDVVEQQWSDHAIHNN